MRSIFPAAIVFITSALSTLSHAAVDHTLLDAVLHEHVKAGQVDYPAIAADKRFATYLEQLAQPASPATKEEKLVYYMNAYNALVIKGILDGRSPSTFFGRQQFFKLAHYRLAGTDTTLNDVEHGILRKLEEPRVHFSIVCASSSCPKLRSDAYLPARLEAQLEENAKGFVNDTSRNRFDLPSKTAYLSQIFKWFEEDFVHAAGSVQKFVARYAADPETGRELARDGMRIKYNDYDWSLNGTPPPAR